MTRLERLIGARIHLNLCGRWVGTGHIVHERRRRGEEDTDSESSETSSDDDTH